MANQDEIARRIVDREVRLCLSSLVSTLANAEGLILRGSSTTRGMDDVQSLADQAFELAAPIPDYEEAARDAGWEEHDGAWRIHVDGDGWNSAPSAQEACHQDDIEPYDREVFEHWAISDWLADKLEARGEKVDRDFAGMIVWARTTTGQAIYCDGVIQDIAADLAGAAA